VAKIASVNGLFWFFLIFFEKKEKEAFASKSLPFEIASGKTEADELLFSRQPYLQDRQ
jgi:hypothetical protein|tara:strand:- start:21 stop:194 length:174 start_codon:yes stop_codon:yes gene_type:complete